MFERLPVKFNFRELTARTREAMLDGLEEEQLTCPYVSERLSRRGRVRFPDLMRVAIASGDEVSLRASLMVSEYWNERASHPYHVELLSSNEFNTWYVWGLTTVLLEDGETHCRVYRAARAYNPHPRCRVHEKGVFNLMDIRRGHRAGYHNPQVPGAISIPNHAGCHHSIERM